MVKIKTMVLVTTIRLIELKSNAVIHYIPSTRAGSPVEQIGRDRTA